MSTHESLNILAYSYSWILAGGFLVYLILRYLHFKEEMRANEKKQKAVKKKKGIKNEKNN